MNNYAAFMRRGDLSERFVFREFLKVTESIIFLGHGPIDDPNVSRGSPPSRCKRECPSFERSVSSHSSYTSLYTYLINKLLLLILTVLKLHLKKSGVLFGTLVRFKRNSPFDY